MTREVVVVGHGGAIGLELTGAGEMLEVVNMWLTQAGQPPGYRVRIMSPAGGPLPLMAGVEVTTRSLDRYAGSIDTLIVVGGPCAPEAAADQNLVRSVRRAARRARRVVSLCSGAFILAAAGLLDGKRATTHWLWGDDLAASYPAVTVDTDPIFIHDGKVWTSAGITAGFDLMLALIEEDEGAEAARFVARIMVVFLRRTSNQAQFSAQLTHQLADRHPLRELQQYILDHPDSDLSLEALARRMRLSPRHFARVFRDEVGVSPGRYVEEVRIDTARRRLEESELSIEAVALACGFGNAGSFRRTFTKAVGVAPLEYRRTFATTRPDGALHRAV
jgi:transcriptional regulator GlxA family with amidase domain